jgi:hypothetical protein
VEGGGRTAGAGADDQDVDATTTVARVAHQAVPHLVKDFTSEAHPLVNGFT